MKFSIKNFFTKCDQIHRKLRIWSHLLKKSLMESFIFCAVWIKKTAALIYKDLMLPNVIIFVLCSQIITDHEICFHMGQGWRMIYIRYTYKVMKSLSVLTKLPDTFLSECWIKHVIVQLCIFEIPIKFHWRNSKALL